MKQRTLAMMTGFEQYTRKTRRAIFLEEMEQVVPWRELCALIEPHYPKPGNGRPPVQPVGPGGGRDAVRLGGGTAKPRKTRGKRSGKGRGGEKRRCRGGPGALKKKKARA